MKAKYKHYGNDCIIYNQIICVDNIVTEVESYTSSWFDTTPKTNTRVCPTNAEARRIFYSLCKKYENKKYDCEYKEANNDQRQMDKYPLHRTGATGYNGTGKET